MKGDSDVLSANQVTCKKDYFINLVHFPMTIKGGRWRRTACSRDSADLTNSSAHVIRYGIANIVSM